MTLNGAIMQLVEMRENSMMPEVFKPYFDKVIETISECEEPSAQPEWKWIPVSKRPPDEGTYVLISKKPDPLSGKKWCVTIAGRFVDGRSKKVEWRDIGFGRIYDDDVLAWMPLPEPYREDGGME